MRVMASTFAAPATGSTNDANAHIWGDQGGSHSKPGSSSVRVDQQSHQNAESQPGRQRPDLVRVPGHRGSDRADYRGAGDDGYRASGERRYLERDRQDYFEDGLISGSRTDQGQTLPLYMVAVTALLFLAFAFFAVGMAEDSRNEAQTAADAAALAAAREARDQLHGSLLAALVAADTSALEDLLGGGSFDKGDACDVAKDYASRNGANTTRCDSVHNPDGFVVDVKTKESVGKTVVEDTEQIYAEATATAVIEPRCDLAIHPTASPHKPKPGPITVTCDGDDKVLDPDNADRDLADLGDFFRVHLSE